MRKRKSRVGRRTPSYSISLPGIIYIVVFLLVILGSSLLIHHLIEIKSENKKEEKAVTKQVERPELLVDLLTVNEYSRPGLALEQVNGIVVHYTANPGSTAQQNRDYFEGLKDSKATKASAHFVVGISGEIVQCIPTKEIAYASNNRNSDTVAIETCHLDESGQYTKETYDSLVALCAFLCGKFNLTSKNIIRHYDVTGKICPKYFVDHEDAWEDFKADVDAYIEKMGKEVTEVEGEAEDREK